MRYVLQFCAMLINIILFLSVLCILVFKPLNPITLILFALVWKKGCSEAWNPKTVKQFLEGARAYNL